jgi:glycosyltransferase involved in cell wall biosynthesis
VHMGSGWGYGVPMDDEWSVTVVVVSRNRKSEVLQTLGRHPEPVILIDNGSTDGTADAVEQLHPTVRVVRLGRNHGATARDLGVALATTPYVAFADDDSWWEPGALDTATRILVVHHHPSPSRSRPQDRAALNLRNRLLTATMRRPWTVVLSQSWRMLRSGAVGLRALLAALPRLRKALTARRVVPAGVEHRLTRLETWQAGRRP